jgi:hypothetical protein
MTTRRQIVTAAAGIAVLCTGSASAIAASPMAAIPAAAAAGAPVEMQYNTYPRGEVVRRGSRGYHRRRWRNRAWRRRYWRRRAWRRRW